MSINWFTNDKQKIATIYETNITLNTAAATYFKNAYSTLIGFDSSKNTLLIKPISKEEATIKNYSSDELHAISIKPSYGRINGKAIVTKLKLFFPLDFSTFKAHKFTAEWSIEENLLKIFLEKEV